MSRYDGPNVISAQLMPNRRDYAMFAKTSASNGERFSCGIALRQDDGTWRIKMNSTTMVKGTFRTMKALKEHLTKYPWSTPFDQQEKIEMPEAAKVDEIELEPFDPEALADEIERLEAPISDEDDEIEIYRAWI